MRKTFVLDWDGTFTDNNERARKSLEQTVLLISEKYGLEKEKVAGQVSDNKQDVLKAEREYAWIHRGHVAAYCEDTLILNNIAVVKLLRKINPERDLSDCWSETLGFLGESYSKTKAVYVPNSSRTLASLLSIGEVVIVTNSSPEKVSSELRSLLGCSETELFPGNLQLRGYAKKYKIDPSLSEVSETMTTEDGRVINLRRKEYYNILSQYDSSSTYVVGDGYSCDLALPRELGFHVCLINDFELMGWARQEMDMYDKGNNLQLITDFLDVVR
jgi:hypothetical protein